MHFDFTVSLPTVFAVVGLWIRFEWKMYRHVVEHEMLVRDYCDRNNLKPGELPTRSS